MDEEYDMDEIPRKDQRVRRVVMGVIATVLYAALLAPWWLPLLDLL